MQVWGGRVDRVGDSRGGSLPRSCAVFRPRKTQRSGMFSPRRFAQMGLAAAVLLAGACIALLASRAAEDQRLMAGQPGIAAPDFTLRDAMDPNGGSVHLADLRGSVVVAYFCSIRCPVSNDY